MGNRLEQFLTCFHLHTKDDNEGKHQRVTYVACKLYTWYKVDWSQGIQKGVPGLCKGRDRRGEVSCGPGNLSGWLTTWATCGPSHFTVWAQDYP